MKYFLILIVSALSFHVLSQDKDVQIIASILDDDNSSKRLTDFSISIYEGDKLEVEVQPKANGKVPPVNIPVGKYYQIFIKKEGYVTKMVELDARIDSIDKAPNTLYLKFETGLFREVDGIDFSKIENNPIVKFYFDSEYFYKYDKEYTMNMIKMIDDLKLSKSAKNGKAATQ